MPFIVWDRLLGLILGLFSSLSRRLAQEEWEDLPPMGGRCPWEEQEPGEAYQGLPQARTQLNVQDPYSLPKKPERLLPSGRTLHRPRRTRPIGVSSTRKRILIDVLVEELEPLIALCISEHQLAWLRNRFGLKHSMGFNLALRAISASEEYAPLFGPPRS